MYWFSIVRLSLYWLFCFSGKTLWVDSVCVWSWIQLNNLKFPEKLVSGFANDHCYKWFLPQRGNMSIELTNHTIFGSSGVRCFISQFKWPTPIPNSIPIWFFRSWKPMVYLSQNICLNQLHDIPPELGVLFLFSNDIRHLCCQKGKSILFSP